MLISVHMRFQSDRELIKFCSILIWVAFFLPHLVIASEPVANYRLDECLWDGTSGEVVDSSGNGLHGTAILSPVSIDLSSESGGVCRGASMGGVSHLSVPDNDLLDINDNLTVSVWVRPDSLPQSGIKSILSKDTNYEFHITRQGQIYWWWRSGGSSYTLTTPANSVSPGSWYHIAIVFQAGTATIYINGNSSISRSGYPVTLNTNSDPLQIGGDYIGSRYFAGVIDEVMVFNEVLDGAAIQSLYIAQRNKRNHDSSERVCPQCVELDDTIVVSVAGSGASLGSPPVAINSSQLVQYRVSTESTSIIENLSDLFSQGGGNVDAAHIATDGKIYFSLDNNNSVTSGGLNVDQDDIVLYDPSSGIVSLYFQGDMHFSTSDANIDALFVKENGNIVLSSSAPTTISGVSFQNEDLVEVNPSTGNASLFFDGSTHFTGDENINGVHLLGTDQLFITTDSDAQLGALSFRKGDIVLYNTTPRVGLILLEGAAAFGSEQDIDTITTPGGIVSVDHYEIRHDGTGLTCNPEEVLIAACKNSDCSVLSSAVSTVTLNPSGWVGGDQVTFTGSQTVQLRHTSPETVTLELSDQLPIALNGYRCVESIGGTTVSCNMEFFSSGFDFTVGTQVSGKRSDTITIRAVREDDSGLRCVPAFADRVETIQFWSTYISPASGTMPLVLGGTSLSSSSPGTGVSLRFNSNGESTFNLLYNDAGQIKLSARYDGDGDEAGLVMLGDSTFVVHPAGLCVYSDGAGSNCASGDGACSPYVAAGTLFPLKVKGVAWESDGEIDSEFCDTNPTTPNYQHSGILLSHNLVAPVTGVLGSMSANSADIIQNGEVSISQTISEVGVFTIIADPPDDYLGAGDVFSSATYTSENIGRFFPDHFDVSILPDPPVLGDSCLVYTYLGQPFDWASVPEITITAKNGASPSARTENYEGGFWKLDTTVEYTYIDTVVDVAATPLTPEKSDQILPDTSDCNGTIKFGLIEDDQIDTNGVRDGFNYSRPSSDSPLAPFEPSVRFRIDSSELTDSDGVCYSTGAGCARFQLDNITGSHLRYGRAVAENVFGPGTNPLIMNVKTVWFDGSAWQGNLDDDCTEYEYLITLSGVSVSSSPSSPVLFSGGVGDLTLTSATTTNRGTATIQFDFEDWLHPDPQAVATFGISRGNDRILNWQEIMR